MGGSFGLRLNRGALSIIAKSGLPIFARNDAKTKSLGRFALASQRKTCLGVLAIAAAAVTAGCASTGTVGGGGTSAPANYRQAVAAELRQMEDVSTIKSAEISKPYESFIGLYRGGTRTIVCVKMVRDNIIGMPALYYYTFYFTDGKADGYQQGAISPAAMAFIGCDNHPLTPFAELVRRK